MKNSKVKVAIVTVLSFACLFSGCGDSSNSSDNAEIESLKAEVESLQEMTVDTSTEISTEDTTSEETTAEESEAAESQSEETTTENTTEESETVTQQNEPIATYKDCTVVLESGTVVADYNGDPAMVLEMTFTNNSNENRSCGFTFAVDAYQDGVECGMAVLYGNDEYDTGTNVTDIKPGVSLTVYKAFKLRNQSSDVVVEVTGIYDFNREVLTSLTLNF